MQSAAGSSGVCLSPGEQEKLKKLMARVGERRLAVDLSLHVSSLSRAAAGLALRRSTARLIRNGLAEPANSPKQAAGSHHTRRPL
jgi:hypothetical protein